MKRLTFLLGAIALWIMPAAAGAFGGWFAHLALLEAAAGRGDPDALTQLAQKYEHGEGVTKDFQKANQLYCRAARAGYAEAQFKLGWIYANGRGVERDEGVAAALFAMAAVQGHEYAGKLLAYVRQHIATQLPSCLLPDPVPVAFDEPHPRDRTEIEQLVHRLAPQYAVDPQLALAVISVESSFNPRAVSPKNAQGLMQLIPETAERFGVRHVFNPVENVKGGLAYLRWLLAFFQGDVPLVLAAYNAGERAVERYRGIPPYPETRNYVRKITGIYKRATHPFQPDVVEPSPVMTRLKSR
jgi:soluble lytic murein transglycosylase-like protein